MTGDTWATLVATVVVPLVLRILVHYFPWLADAVTPGSPTATPPAAPSADLPPEAADGA